MNYEEQIFSDRNVKAARARFIACMNDWREAAPNNDVALTTGLTPQQRSVMVLAMEAEQTYLAAREEARQRLNASE